MLEEMLGSTRLPLTLLAPDSIILPLYRSNPNGRGLWGYLALDLMRISMKLVLPNLSRGCMMVWASWEFGSIPYVVSSVLPFQPPFSRTLFQSTVLGSDLEQRWAATMATCLVYKISSPWSTTPFLIGLGLRSLSS